jgi:hypothetical protein
MSDLLDELAADLDGRHKLRKLEVSVMPSYEKTLSPSEIDQVVSYLASLKATP